MVRLHAAVAADSQPLEWVPTSVERPAQRAPLLLVVDSHDDSHALMRLLFETGGLRVSEWSDGERVVEEIARLQPDLIILEERLPHIDGRTACQRLRSASETIRHTPVIFTSSSSLPSPRQLAFEAGCTLYFVKPIDVQELMGAVIALLTAAAALS
jgi:CheY-like chemotaxis protein